MDLQTLQYFCIVAEEGSLSKAARKLHYAQSNLSTKMSQLEAEVGSALFYRNNHGVILTPKGELLYTEANRLIRMANHMMIAMREDLEEGGTLKVGAMESAVATYVADLLASFHQNHKNISVELQTDYTEELLRQVLEHRLDFAIVAGPVVDEELIAKHVCMEKLCLIAAKTMAQGLTVEELLQKPILVFPKGCSYRNRLENAIRDQGFPIRKRYEFSTLSGIFASACAGLGVAAFPKSCLEQYQQAKALVVMDLPEAYAMSQTVLVYRKDTYLTTAMKLFLKEFDLREGQKE